MICKYSRLPLFNRSFLTHMVLFQLHLYWYKIKPMRAHNALTDVQRVLNTHTHKWNLCLKRDKGGHTTAGNYTLETQSNTFSVSLFWPFISLTTGRTGKENERGREMAAETAGLIFRQMAGGKRWPVLHLFCALRSVNSLQNDTRQTHARTHTYTHTHTHTHWNSFMTVNYF